jgi:hypothetical protein
MKPDSVGPSFQQADREILIVLGGARSGTTLLHTLLLNHFGYGMGPEGTFVEAFARRLRRYGDLGDERNLRRLVMDVSNCEMLEIARTRQQGQFDITPELIWSHLRDRTYAGVVYSVFECIAEIQNRPRVGNKNPEYLRHLDLLTHLFPTQAKYLCIVRDGRDVALSNMKERWGQSSVFACAQTWSASLEAVARLKRQVEPDRVLVFRYEDLLTNPLETLTGIREFLDVPPEDANVAEAAEAIQKGGKTSNFDKWRAQMAADDVRKYEAVAGAWLTEYGYVRDFESPQVRPGEQFWYSAKEFLRLVETNVRARLDGIALRARRAR